MLVVSVHDVAPSTLEQVTWLLERLDVLDVRPRVLDVIPCRGGHEDVRSDDRLVNLLQAEAAAGSEIVMHGYAHLARDRTRGDPLTVLRARWFAARTAEFASLDRAEMARRLAAGRAALADIGLTVDGFCAPAWLSTQELPALLRDAGFGYLATFTGLLELERNRRLFVPSAGYVGSDRVTEALTRLGSAIGETWAGLTHGGHPRHRRLFLHPSSASTSPDCARVLRRIGELRRTHVPATNASLLDA